MPRPDVARRAWRRDARDRAAQPRARRHRLSADHARRGAARLSPFRRPVRAPSLVVTARSSDLGATRATRRRGHRRHHRARHPLAACRHQIGVAVAQCAGQAGRARAGAREAWLVDGSGRVTEGASSNAWIVDRDGKLITHPLGRDILPGITRSVVIDVIKAQGLAFEERAFTVEEAYAAREAFVTSASQIVQPVVRIDGRPVGDGAPGPIATALRRDFHRHAEFSLTPSGSKTHDISVVCGRSRQLALAPGPHCHLMVPLGTGAASRRGEAAHTAAAYV